MGSRSRQISGVRHKSNGQSPGPLTIFVLDVNFTDSWDSRASISQQEWTDITVALSSSGQSQPWSRALWDPALSALSGSCSPLQRVTEEDRTAWTRDRTLGAPALGVAERPGTKLLGVVSPRVRLQQELFPCPSSNTVLPRWTDLQELRGFWHRSISSLLGPMVLALSRQGT